MSHQEIFSVSGYLDRLNVLLKTEKAKIQGEVCGIQMYEGRSYLYFSVKDSKDQSTVKCFMWKRDFALSGVALSEGVEVVITAYPNVYKPNGGLTMQVELVEMVGEGALQKAYEELKKKLLSEGLFSQEKKRKIPEFPHKIGIITSKSGAVINDFLSNIGKFGYSLHFVDSKVEGQDAIKDLLSAVETLRKKDLDVLVVMRGGGSLESFQAFNNETLVRAIASFPVPVITGIGHDKDLPLISMVSDKNVSTPTAVANLLNSSWSEALSQVLLSEEKIVQNFQSALRDKQYFIENSRTLIQKSFEDFLLIFHKAEATLLHGLTHIGNRIKVLSENIAAHGRELTREFLRLTQDVSAKILDAKKTLELSSPERQLARGYSIIRRKGKLVKSVNDVRKGDELDIQLSDGIIGTITQ